MYTRGQLALIGNVGRKAIRLYEQDNLISSSKINPENGYHYYDDEQIDRLYKIKEYKKLGFTLAEIKEILCNGISEKEIANEKKIELQRDIKSMQTLYRNLEKMVQNERKKEVSELNNLQIIDEQDFKESACLFIEENVELEKLGTSVGKLYEKAARNNYIINGAHFVKYEGLLSEDTDFKMTTCLPIIFSDVSNNHEDYIYKQNSVKCIHMNFLGGFSKVGSAHIEIKKYMDQHNIAGNGIVYEVYNTDMSVDIFYELEQTKTKLS